MEELRGFTDYDIRRGTVTPPTLVKAKKERHSGFVASSYKDIFKFKKTERKRVKVRRTLQSRK